MKHGPIGIAFILMLLACFIPHIAHGLPDQQSPLSVVLAWLTVDGDTTMTANQESERATRFLSYQLRPEDSFDFMTVPADAGDFLGNLEQLLLEAASTMAEIEDGRRVIILMIDGQTQEDLSATNQARELTLLNRITPAFLEHRIQFYGVATATPPRASFLTTLASASNRDPSGDNHYWFRAESEAELAHAYARILIDARDPALLVRYAATGPSLIQVMMAVGIVGTTLIGMGLLTRFLLPAEFREVLFGWWKKAQDEEYDDEFDLVSEVDTIILGTVPENGADLE